MGNPYSKKNRKAQGFNGRKDDKGPVPKASKAETNSFVMLLKLVIEKYGLMAGPSAVNLANLKQYDELKDQYLDFNSMRTCEAVIICLQKHFISVDTISFDHNGIKSPAVLLNMIKRLGMAGIFKALSFKDNLITDLAWVQMLRGFSSIQELRCIGCPVSNEKFYRRQISKTLPSLILLDDKNTERVSLSLPWPKYPGGVQGEIRTLCMQLVQGYEETMRSNIDTISQFYHPDATLTYTTSNNFSTALPHGSNIPEVKESVRIQQLLGEWNHNISKISPTSNKCQKIINGSAEISQSLVSIFKTTRIKITRVVDADQHVSVTQPGMGGDIQLGKEPTLLVKIHGTYVIDVPSLNQSVQRCFDQVWTLVRSESGNIVIFNDLLHIRSSEPSPLWKPAMGDRSVKLSKKYGLTEDVCQEIISLSTNDIQCSLIIEFVAVTRLKPQTALFCLNQAENDFERAQKLFEEKKALLGGEHYL